MRARRILGYLLITGGALFLYFGARDLIESRAGQHEAERQFEDQPAPKPSPFHYSPSLRRSEEFIARPNIGEAVARLEIPRLGVDLYVVEGDGANQLRVGPGHAAGTALPGQNGNCIIAGHRDTHFRVLKDIRGGDEIILQTRGGQYRYRVNATQVISPRDLRPLGPTRDAELRLVTCYPFYYIGSAPKRFIVRAQLEPATAADRSAPDIDSGAGSSFP